MKLIFFNENDNFYRIYLLRNFFKNYKKNYLLLEKVVFLMGFSEIF